MAKSFVLQLDEIQPSQLYINAAKLERVQAGTKSAEALPVRELGERIVLTDGHTRAFAAFLAGQQEIEVYWDKDELDWEAYEICVGWCLKSEIRSIADLVGRILAPEQYQVLWLQRCAEMQWDLAEKRRKE